jgi:hypothetical protein
MVDERTPTQLYDFNMALHDAIAEAGDFVLGTHSIGVVAANHKRSTFLTFIFAQSTDKAENYRAAIDWIEPREHVTYHIIGGDIDG